VPPGILVLDNNCYSQLTKPSALSNFRANLRVIDFVAQPSEVNLLEAAAAPSRARSQLFKVLREVIGEQPILMWPFALLKNVGQAILRGEPHVIIGDSGKEWYLDDEEAVAALRPEVKEFKDRLEQEFDRLHARNRKSIQKKMRERGIETTFFESTAHFLDTYWQQSDSRLDYANATWTAFGLPGDAPVDALNLSESWRLLLDAEGVAVYERAIARVQPKFVHRLDLIQLTYLALAPRRMIATADGPLLRAGNAILSGRYSNARAIHIRDLVN
jgi:hypothetical protein